MQSQLGQFCSLQTRTSKNCLIEHIEEEELKVKLQSSINDIHALIVSAQNHAPCHSKHYIACHNQQ